MAESLLLALLVATLVAHPIFAQEEIVPLSGGEYSDVALSPEEEYYLLAPGESPDEIYKANSPAMAYDVKLLKSYSPEQMKFLKKCAEKMASECGKEIFTNMVDETPVTTKCCREVLMVGQECHVGLVRVVFSTYEYKDFASKGIPRSKQTWNKCVREVGNEIGAPVAFEI